MSQTVSILAVPGAPDAPTVADILKESCIVNWQPPTSDGGSPITGFHLQRRATTSQHWIKVIKEPLTELSVKATELVESNEYQFRVAAENKAGIGEYSPPSEPFTAKDPWEKPGKPGRPEASEVTGRTASLTWTAPESDGGAEIFNYIIEYRVQEASLYFKQVHLNELPSRLRHACQLNKARLIRKVGTSQARLKKKQVL